MLTKGTLLFDLRHLRHRRFWIGAVFVVLAVFTFFSLLIDCHGNHCASWGDPVNSFLVTYGGALIGLVSCSFALPKMRLGALALAVLVCNGLFFSMLGAMKMVGVDSSDHMLDKWLFTGASYMMLLAIGLSCAGLISDRWKIVSAGTLVLSLLGTWVLAVIGLFTLGFWPSYPPVPLPASFLRLSH